jgi:muramoyltetrapeptide carboxypeptidase
MATPALREGDTIAVVAPAGPVPMDRLKPALALLEKHFRILVADDIDRREGFLAGDDAGRADEFNAALRDPDVRCIWAARGGYGCSRIVSSLDGDALQKDPVPIVGFSDITVLLSWAARLGLRSIHGPVLTQFGELPEGDRRWLVDMLLGKQEEILFAEGLQAAQSHPPIEGRLVGGNLSLLAHLCGTEMALDYRDALCIIEDVGERPYAIDRYLQQLLSQESKPSLVSAAGVLLGDFTGCEEASDSSQDPIETALTRLRAAALPCASGLPLGHGNQNRAFPFGGRARLEDGKLWLLESATRLDR